MRVRRLLTVGALTLTCLAVTPVAQATTVAAPSCSATVEGMPGQRVVLDPAAVTEPVVHALAPLDPLGVLTSGFRSAWADTAPIVVGTIPDGTSEIGGNQVADAVVARLGQLPVLAPVLQTLASGVRGALASVCTLVLHGVGAVPPVVPAPGTPAPGSPAPAPGQPGGTVKPPVGDDRAPLPVPVGGAGSPSLGSGAVFGSRLPDLMPGGALFPLLGPGVPGSPGTGGADRPAVVSAPESVGSAETLPTRQDVLSPAVLTALLLLSVVSAQLVRRWVLGPRR